MPTPNQLARKYVLERSVAQRALIQQALARAAGLESATDRIEDYSGWSTADFVTKKLGMAPWAVQWSLLPEYERHQWDGTKDPIKVMYDCIDRGENCAAESGTGTSKTYAIAAACLAFLAKYPGAMVLTFAPVEKQLKVNLWKEIERFWPAFQLCFPGSSLDVLRLRRRRGADAEGIMLGYGCRVRVGQSMALSAKGMHAPQMMVVYEEMPGIEQAVIDAIEHTCVGEFNVRVGLGNPDSTSDALHRFAERRDVVPIRISAFDHPNVVTKNPDLAPGAVTLKSILERSDQYGQDTPVFRAQIRGISPDQATNALIRWTWLKSCAENYENAHFRYHVSASMISPKPQSRGIDVANSATGDEAAVARFMGECCIEVESIRVGKGMAIRDCNVLGNVMAYECREQRIPPERCGVDSVGVGAGTVNEMNRVGFPCQALGGGETAPIIYGQQEEFNNLRSAMWWQARVDLQAGRITLPPFEKAPQLWRDLTEVRWRTNPTNGKIEIEPKEKIIERLKRSPDQGDAFVYANWVRISRGSSHLGGFLGTL